MVSLALAAGPRRRMTSGRRRGADSSGGKAEAVGLVVYMFGRRGVGSIAECVGRCLKVMSERVQIYRCEPSTRL